MRNTILKMLVLAIMVITGLVLAPMASASSTLHPVVPGGLPTNNSTKAWSVLRERADSDPSLAAKLASTAGANKFNSADFHSAGYSNGAPGSVNSGVTDAGTLLPSGDTGHCNVHSKMLVLINIRTQTKVFVCTACANPRLFVQHPPAFHHFAKSTVVKYRRKMTKTFTICPAPQQVSVNVTVLIKGKLRARTWGKIRGELRSHLAASFNAKLQVLVKAKCPGAPVPQVTPSTVVNVNPTIVNNNSQQQQQGQQQQQQQCQAGWVVNSKGVCEQKQEQTQVVCQAGQVLVNNQCTTPPPPSCPSGQIGTPPNCHVPTCQELNNCPPPPPTKTPNPSASASSNCPTGGGNGNITVTLRNSGDADANIVVEVNGSPTSYIVGPGGTKTVSLTLSTSTDVHVRVASAGSLLLDQTFQHCNQPPPPSSPPSATVDFVQEIDASDFSVNPQITYTAPIRVHVSAPSGDSLTVTLTVRYGSWPQHNSVQTLTSTGTDLVTATYQSPTESGVKEQVKAVVFDNTTRLSTTAYSNEFDVVQPPAPPA